MLFTASQFQATVGGPWWEQDCVGLTVDFLDGSGESSRAYLYRYQGLALFYDWRPLEVLIDA